LLQNLDGLIGGGASLIDHRPVVSPGIVGGLGAVMASVIHRQNGVQSHRTGGRGQGTYGTVRLHGQLEGTANTWSSQGISKWRLALSISVDAIVAFVVMFLLGKYAFHWTDPHSIGMGIVVAVASMAGGLRGTFSRGGPVAGLPSAGST